MVVKTRQAVLRLAQDKKSVLLGRNCLSCREIRRGGAWPEWRDPQMESLLGRAACGGGDFKFQISDSNSGGPGIRLKLQSLRRFGAIAVHFSFIGQLENFL
jgi:hypothetical protein